MSHRHLLWPLLAGLLGFACAGLPLTGSRTVTGSGVLTTETRPVTGFTEIVLAGFGDVSVTLGDHDGLVVEAEDNLLPYLTSDVVGSRLELALSPGVSLNPTEAVRFQVTVTRLEAVTLSGSGYVGVPQVTADQLSLELPGSGLIDVAGQVEQLTVSLPGSGTVAAGDLQAREVSVHLPGSGSVEVWATEQLSIDLPGSGTVGYYGLPSTLEQTLSGSGNIVSLGDK